MRILIVLLLFAAAATAQREAREKLLEEGRYAEALAAHRDLLRAQGPSYEAFMGLGRARFGLHDLDGAIADFERAAQLDPTSATPLSWRGRAFAGLAEEALQAGDDVWRERLRSGAEAHRAAAKLASDPFDALRQAAECWFRLGDGESALEDVDAALASRPDDGETLWLRARCLFTAARYEDYLAAAEKLDVAHDLDYHCSRLIALARLERHAAVEREFMALVGERGFGDVDRPYVVLSTEWSSTKALRRLTALLERVAAAPDSGVTPHYWLGVARSRLGLFAAGAAAFARYLDTYPEAVNVLCDHSQASLLAGDVAAAHASARRAITLAPGNPDARARVGSVIGKYVEERAFEKALDLHELLVVAAPEDPDVARNHAALLKENGKPEDAVLRLESLCASARVEIERAAVYLNDLGLCLKGLGRIEEAERRFQEAADTWPFQVDARENLGVLRYEQGRYAEAEKLLIEAIDVHDAESDPMVGPRYRSRYYLRRIRAIDRRR